MRNAVRSSAMTNDGPRFTVYKGWKLAVFYVKTWLKSQGYHPPRAMLLWMFCWQPSWRC